jgi:hypothetical protein
MTEPVSEIVGMKNWDDQKRCWIGVICQIMRGDDGKKFVHVYDCERAETQVEIDDLIRKSIETRPWEGPR